MAAKNPRSARWGNIIAGLVLMGMCVPFGLMGGEGRQLLCRPQHICNGAHADICLLLSGSAMLSSKALCKHLYLRTMTVLHGYILQCTVRTQHALCRSLTCTRVPPLRCAPRVA
jgi:hypothetical protein